MNYAVIKTGGKQYKVAEGEVITVERLPVEANQTLTFPVLMSVAGDTVLFGQPLVEGLVVTGKVVEHLRGEKIRVAKFKAKARYRRVTGHRQELSKVIIEAIGDSKKSAKTKENAVKVEKAVESTTPVKKTVIKKSAKPTTKK
jgi:large subunit ribosomal protein L21